MGRVLKGRGLARPWPAPGWTGRGCGQTNDVDRALGIEAVIVFSA